jgi:hypothetical protein
VIQTLDLFRPLDGRDFACDRELQEAVLKIFNAHLAEMPPGYLYTQLIDWGRWQGWIRRTELGWSVRLPQETKR